MQVSKRLVNSVSSKASETTADRNSGFNSSEGKMLFELVTL